MTLVECLPLPPPTAPRRDLHEVNILFALQNIPVLIEINVLLQWLLGVNILYGHCGTYLWTLWNLFVDIVELICVHCGTYLWTLWTVCGTLWTLFGDIMNIMCHFFYHCLWYGWYCWDYAWTFWAYWTSKKLCSLRATLTSELQVILTKTGAGCFKNL